MIFEFEATPDFFLCFNLIVRIFYQSQDLSWKTQKKCVLHDNSKKKGLEANGSRLCKPLHNTWLRFGDGFLCDCRRVALINENYVW